MRGADESHVKAGSSLTGTQYDTPSPESEGGALPSAAMPAEHEIRALVATIVDGVLAGPESEQAPAEPVGKSVAIGADHGGFRLKEFLVFRLKEAGWEVVDCGTHSEESVDYPEFAHAVAAKVVAGESAWGIVVDGAGIGSAIAANKVPGIRAALCYDVSSARNSREHNHANVLTLGAGLIGRNLAWQIVETWLATDWEPGRHQRRVEMISEIDRRYRRDA